MKGQIQKWGNSLALRIPRGVAEEVRLEQSSNVDISVREGSIIITPAQGRRYVLSELLARITPENVHQETDWGAPQGQEEW